jgi:hypothetical protein
MDGKAQNEYEKFWKKDEKRFEIKVTCKMLQQFSIH